MTKLPAIVTYAHRPKRPPRKRKAVALDAVVQRVRPGNDNRPEPELQQPAIVSTTSRKRTKLLRAERAPDADADPDAEEQVRAFFARMVRPRDA